LLVRHSRPGHAFAVIVYFAFESLRPFFPLGIFKVAG